MGMFLVIMLSASLSASGASASNMKDINDCEQWMMSMVKVLTKNEFADDLAKHHPGENPALDTVHDLEKNDPSNPHTELSLDDQYYHQDWLIVKGVNPHINDNIKGAFKKILRDAPENAETVLKKPETKEMLAIHKDRYQPLPENGPATVNSNPEFCGISDRSHGYCWGYATLVRDFHTLAFYDANLPKLKTTAEYLKKIDDVLAGKATLIPGYKNLRELSLVPEYELYLKLNAMELWKTRAVRWSSLPIFKNASKPMEISEQAALVTELEKRLARNELPKVIFSSLIPTTKVMGMNADIHVVLANKIEKMANGSTRIYIWDINFYAETLQKEPKFLEITADHKIRYQPWYDEKVDFGADKSDLIASIQLAPENDAETIGMIRSLKEFCKKHPKYCKE